MTSECSLTLYFIPSPFGLNWDTPTTLARDIVKNYVAKGKFGNTKRFMGHVNIELKYNDNGREVHILTGMVASKLDAIGLLLKEKVGLGIIFHSFPGRLESKEELDSELDHYSTAGNTMMNFCKYLITPLAAKRIEQYLNDYKANDIGRYYGLFNSPLHGEGAGCSAFGASFLDVIGGLNTDHKKNWANKVVVPHSLIGAPLNKKNKVSFFKLLLQNHKWLNKKTDDSHEIFFWDPDLMYQDTQRKLKNMPKDVKEIKIKNMSGLQYDLTNTQAPETPIFKRLDKNGKTKSFTPEFEINSNFHKYN
jgi:hypothetical protein